MVRMYVHMLPKSSDMLNKNTLGVKKVRRYVQPKTLISAEAKKATI